MHKILPKIFIFLDHYNDQLFKNNNINIGIIYRNYQESNRKIELKKIAKACKKRRYQLFVSNDIKLALKEKADGVYIPSFNKSRKFINLQKKNFTILGSAHNQKQIHEKISQKCKVIFLSPVFYVNKSNNFLDLYKFNLLAFSNKVKFIALGGINSQNIKKLKLLRIAGFAGISIFKKKTGLLKAGFLKNNFF